MMDCKLVKETHFWISIMVFIVVKLCHPLNYIEQNIFLFDPPTYSKQFRNATIKDGFLIWSSQ